MADRADRIRLEHILQAAREAVGYAVGRARNDLDADRPLVHSLVRCLEVFGEASARLSEGFRQSHPALPWRDIVGMRNRLIHAYFNVNLDIVWRTVRNELPALIKEVESALAGREAPDPPSAQTASQETTMNRRRTQYRMLGDADIQRIHAASLEILRRTGMAVQDEGGRALLKKAGCSVDGTRVRIPDRLVDEALKTAPRRVTLHRRTGEEAMVLEGWRTWYGTGSDCPFTLDLDTGQRRETVRRDVVDLARLVDALPNLDFVMCMAIAKDVPKPDSFVHQFAAMMEGTTKPLVFTASHIDDMTDIHAMASAVAGSPEALAERPFLLLYSEPIPPLTHTNMGIEKLIYCARHGVPVTYPTGAMAGATAPVTLAGAVALGNAECLAGLVIHQLARPGAPFVYGGNTTAMDMASCTFPYAAPEFHMCFSAYADLAHHYGLPVWALAGASDAKTPDAQAGAEAGVQILMAELSGAQLIHDMGYLDSGLTSSAEMIVLCDELAGMARRISRGIEINDDTLALDVIDEVGPGGHYLTHRHTVDHFRGELWFPRVVFRGHFAAWEAEGRRDMRHRLNERARTILSDHAAPPLPAAAQARIHEILAARADQRSAATA